MKKKILSCFLAAISIIFLLPASVSADNAVIVTRLSGKGRTQTAVAISKEGFDKTENVVLASGDNYADALAGAPLAYALDAPILLVQKHQLNADTLAEIERLGATNIYILGGTAAIGDTVVYDLESKGCTVERIKGKNRFDTAVAIAEYLVYLCGYPDEVFFAYSHNYPDALAISGIAAAKGCPVLYIAKDGKLSDSTEGFIRSCGASMGTILGGTGVISSDAESNLKSAGLPTANRISGKNRYITCLKINEAYADILTGDSICLATGTNFPDALAGGVFAALNRSPMILVDKKNVSDEQRDFFNSRTVREVFIFGGTGAVPDNVANEFLGIPSTSQTTTKPVTASTTAPSPSSTATTKTTTTTKKTTTTTKATTTKKTTTTTKATSSVNSGDKYYIYANTIVYRASSSAKKFHRTSDCSSMKSPISLTYSQAISKGLSPCKNCCANCIYSDKSK